MQGFVAVWMKEQGDVQACSSNFLPGVSVRWEPPALQGWPGELCLRVGLACEQRWLRTEAAQGVDGRRI